VHDPLKKANPPHRFAEDRQHRGFRKTASLGIPLLDFSPLISFSELFQSVHWLSCSLVLQDSGSFHMSPMLLCGIVSLSVAALCCRWWVQSAAALVLSIALTVTGNCTPRAVPLTGGPTIVMAVTAGMAAALWVDPQVLMITRGDTSFLLCLAGAAAVIVLVGILDDRFSLRGRQKLLGQFVAACLMLPSGIAVDHVSVFGWTVQFGDLGFLFTLFWILGAINALNLIDGVDGLASTTGIVLALSVAAVTLILDGRPDGLLMSLAAGRKSCRLSHPQFPTGTHVSGRFRQHADRFDPWLCRPEVLRQTVHGCGDGDANSDLGDSDF
jgi:hypothetical protein